MPRQRLRTSSFVSVESKADSTGSLQTESASKQNTGYGKSNNNDDTGSRDMSHYWKKFGLTIARINIAKRSGLFRK
ncbi:hypothetical protein EK599_09310 [Vibrio sp. T187]|uniref:hypothetical protein n=1 Tax=Vibrio TaxID=662 RepID=UPI0010C9BA6A|nr:MULTISPECIES: hypothetical protein [Vibrio]MBW3695892.1 hypothetical protein [Vibrio sp. T187]